MDETRPEIDETETETGETSLKSHETGGGTVVRLWTDRETICRTLGISRSTFYRRMKNGLVESRKVEGATRYRVVGPVRPAVGQSHETGETRGETETGTDETGPGAGTGETETGETGTGETETGTDGTVDLAPLVGLVERLTDRLVEAEARNHELELQLVRSVDALGLANRDVRRLHESLEAVLDGITEVATSPLSIPLRPRLRAILAT